MYITLFDQICQPLFCCNKGRKRKYLLTLSQFPDIIMKLASVAQSVVHLTRNEKVACSSQVTSSKNHTKWCGFLFNYNYSYT